MSEFPAFRLGDVRGLYPEEINEEFVTGFAHAFVAHFRLQGRIATGRDMRDSSRALQAALNDALAEAGMDVVDIGLCPTELGYFASGLPDIHGAIVVTASHNPAPYNGLKCVLSNGRAITADSGLEDIRTLMISGYRHLATRGSISTGDFRERYLEFLRSRFPSEELQGGAVALNGLNGTAATMAGIIAAHFELPVTWFRKTPGPIPQEGADPANPSLVREMQSFMKGQDFSMGVAWDGDCDRCVTFQGDGELIPTYYLIGLLAEEHLQQSPGAAIVFDTKLCWNVLDIIENQNGVAVPAKTGHAFMKQMMHQHGAVYGGELSAHHYFGDFFGCDSGMFAWLSTLQLVNRRGESLQRLIEARRQFFCCTPEISAKISDVDAAFRKLRQHFGSRALQVNEFDGVSYEMPGDWRFSVTPSKTEPLVRLNFEGRGESHQLLEEGPEVLNLLESFRHDDRDWLQRFTLQ